MTRQPVAAEVRTLFRLLADGAEPGEIALADWGPILAFADRTQLTLHLRRVDGLPDWVREEIEARFTSNAERRMRLREVYAEIAHAFARAGIEFVLLKGFTHEAGFGIEPGARVQYDLDLLSPHVDEARRALSELGYRPHGTESLSDEHDRPWVKRMGWAWRGDYFDPEMPVALEMHSTPWNPRRDRIAVEGLDKFWSRRRTMQTCGIGVPAYSEPDRLAFAALHVLRHLLRNDARPAHVYELARFLSARRSDARFWADWQSVQTDDVKRLAGVAFGFAQQWFGCELPEAAERGAELLPESVRSWFREFAWSPVVNLTEPNKDIVWLHLALVGRMTDRFAVMRSRLAPLRLPRAEESPDANSGRVWKRVRYHAAGSTLALARGARWWWRQTTSSTASHTPAWNRSSV